MTNDCHNPPQREWFDLRGLRSYASVSERTLRGWIRLEVNPLPAVQVRGKILVRRTEFDSWLEQHRLTQVDVDGIVKELVEGISSGN